MITGISGETRHRSPVTAKESSAERAHHKNNYSSSLLNNALKIPKLGPGLYKFGN